MSDIPPIREVADIDIFTIAGTVLDVQLTSETEVYSSSSGGGGYIGPNGGHVHAPNVSVSSTTHQRAHIFLRKNNGQETDIDIRNPKIGIRTGNKLSVIYAGPKSAERGYMVALYNHDTCNQAIYDSGIERNLKRMNPGIALVILAGLPLSGCVVGSVADGAISQIIGISGLLAYILFFAGIILAFYKVMKAKTHNDMLKRVINDRAKSEIDRISQQARVAVVSKV